MKYVRILRDPPKIKFGLIVSGLSTVDASSIDDIEDSNVAYEVLQELPNNGGSFIITQSGVSQSLQTPLSEHIIVQTVPATEVNI